MVFEIGVAAVSGGIGMLADSMGVGRTACMQASPCTRYIATALQRHGRLKPEQRRAQLLESSRIRFEFDSLPIYVSLPHPRQSVRI